MATTSPLLQQRLVEKFNRDMLYSHVTIHFRDLRGEEYVLEEVNTDGHLVLYGKDADGNPAHAFLEDVFRIDVDDIVYDGFTPVKHAVATWRRAAWGDLLRFGVE